MSRGECHGGAYKSDARTKFNKSSRPLLAVSVEEMFSGAFVGSAAKTGIMKVIVVTEAVEQLVEVFKKVFLSGEFNSLFCEPDHRDHFLTREDRFCRVVSRRKDRDQGPDFHATGKL